ncbi:hypothetical protein PhCBS80983_g05558 [Powellomyces hirtus]|uniref:C2H2-type domain-containing protein n=1 Tax=Powellomyces hirtus TaxID=109895 RepID=A0A507DUC1_9FUNG|nr:hypothetical protein PhCBS80983_g05558 [Powellomyces hirtus]
MHKNEGPGPPGHSSPNAALLLLSDLALTDAAQTASTQAQTSDSRPIPVHSGPTVTMSSSEARVPVLPPAHCPPLQHGVPHPQHLHHMYSVPANSEATPYQSSHLAPHYVMPNAYCHVPQFPITPHAWNSVDHRHTQEPSIHPGPYPSHYAAPYPTPPLGQSHPGTAPHLVPAPAPPPYTACTHLPATSQGPIGPVTPYQTPVARLSCPCALHHPAPYTPSPAIPWQGVRFLPRTSAHCPPNMENQKSWGPVYELPGYQNPPLPIAEHSYAAAPATGSTYFGHVVHQSQYPPLPQYYVPAGPLPPPPLPPHYARSGYSTANAYANADADAHHMPSTHYKTGPLEASLVANAEPMVLDRQSSPHMQSTGFRPVVPAAPPTSASSLTPSPLTSQPPTLPSFEKSFSSSTPCGSGSSSANGRSSPDASTSGEAEKGGSAAPQILKRYVCPNCPKRFTRPSSLKTHLNSHTGDKPYSCTCGRRFSVLSNLRRHERGGCAARGTRNPSHAKEDETDAM